MSSGILLSLLDQVDKLTANFVFNGYQHVVSAYSSAIVGLVCLSIVIFGYAVINGNSQLSLAEVSKRVLTIGFVITLAMNWGYFSEYVYKTFTVLPDQLSTQLMHAMPDVHYGDQGGVNAALQDAFYEGIKVGNATWDRGGMSNILSLVFAVFIYILVFILVGLALVELIAAKFGLAIYLVLAPVVIPLFLFQAMKSAIFDGWFKHLITFAFIPIFICTALGLGLSLMATSADFVQAGIHVDKLSITQMCGYVVSTLICIGLVWKATAMASSTAGGFATEGASYLGAAASRVSSLRRRKQAGNNGGYSIKGDNNTLHFHTNQPPSEPTN